MVLINELNGNKPIKEPIWKLTQQFILDKIEAALFPRGFEASLSSLDSADDDANWKHGEISKLHLAKLVETDFLNFCRKRGSFSDSGTYDHPLYDIPDIPAARPPPQKSLSTKNSAPKPSGSNIKM
jgi:hypothetical protein